METDVQPLSTAVRIPRSRILGIQAKILFMLIFVMLFTVIIGASGLIGVIGVKRSSDAVIHGEVPLLRSIEEALSAMTIGQLAAERALDIDDINNLSNIDADHEKFSDSVSRFKMFIAAITWGSDSQAFLKSNGGENARAWTVYDPMQTLIVPQASSDEVQLAGQTAIYFEGFVSHVGKAIDERKKYINFRANKMDMEATSAMAQSKEHILRARVFADYVVQNLRHMVELSSTSIGARSDEVTAVQKQVVRSIIITGIIGILFSLLTSLFFARHLFVKPINSLLTSVVRISQGNFSERTTLDTGDEIELLGKEFNDMADHLAHYTDKLEKAVEHRTKELNEKVVLLNTVNAKLDSNATLLMRREKDLTLANEKLLELDRVKSEFLSIAAHQLRTPLSAIKWTISVLLEGNLGTLNNDQKGYLMKGETSNNRMIRLVDEMLTVTRIESGKAEYHFYTLSLHDILNNLVEDFMPKAKDAKITLGFESSPRIDPDVVVDPEKIRYLFENILENAIRYTNEGGEIEIRLKEEDHKLVTTVKDTGIGIPHGEQKNIFTKFFRAENAMRMATDGSGLGLYVAKSVALRHGGDISFESTQGSGTIFRVTLPHASEGIPKDIIGDKQINSPT